MPTATAMRLHLPGAGQRRHGQRRGGSRPDAEHHDGQCHPGERRAGRARTTTVTTNEDTAYTFARPTSASAIRTTTRPTRLLAVKITTLPGAGTLTDNGVAVTRRPVRDASPTSPAGMLMFTPAANANGNGYARFTFQVQDNGGTANGGVDLDPTPNTHHDQCHPGQRRAGRTRTTTVTTNEDTAYTFSAADFGFSDPNDTPANSLLAVEDHDPAGRRHADRQRRRGDRRPVVSVADITGGKLVFTPAANANGNGYAELHLPGAGQRRHGQRRGGSRSDAQHDHGQRHAGQRRAGRHQQDGDHATKTPPTPSRRPTSASAIRTTLRPTACWR